MNSFECARLLIHHSANVNRRDKSGSTPLHLCCAYGIPELIPLLLASGSLLHILDKDRKTALDLAEDRGDVDEAYLACAVLLRRHMDLFQNEEISKVSTRPFSWSNETDHSTEPPFPSDPPGSSPRRKVLPPFIAGSTMRVAQWEWDRALAEYSAVTKNFPRQTFPQSSSPPRDTSPLLDERPKSPVSFYSPNRTAEFSSPKLHLSLSRSLGSSRPVSSHQRVASLPPALTTKQPLSKKSKNRIPLFLPFKPKAALVGDVFLSVEMCADCHLHNWSLWHNEDRYNGAANECLRLIIHDLIRHCPRIRLFAYKTKIQPQCRERIGALEVLLAIKVASEDVALVPQPSPSSRCWAVHSIFSKLKTKRSPLLAESILIFDSWPKPSTFKDSGSLFVNSVVDRILGQNLPRRSLSLEEHEEPLSRRKRGGKLCFNNFLLCLPLRNHVCSVARSLVWELWRC
jgi:hypothetical protein